MFKVPLACDLILWKFTLGYRTARNLRAAEGKTAALPFGHPLPLLSRVHSQISA